MATNWLLKVLRSPPKIAAVNLSKKSKTVTFWAQALHLTFLDSQSEDGDFFGGPIQSTSKSQLVANSKLGGGSIMIFCNHPKSCTPNTTYHKLTALDI